MELVAARSEDDERAMRALSRVGDAAAEVARARFDGAPPQGRARLTRLVGSIAAGEALAPSARQDIAGWLQQRLADPGAAVRRAAAIALGKPGVLAPDEVPTAVGASGRRSPPSEMLRRAEPCSARSASSVRRQRWGSWSPPARTR